jgi:hypothetical protein
MLLITCNVQHVCSDAAQALGRIGLHRLTGERKGLQASEERPKGWLGGSLTGPSYTGEQNVT